MIIQLLKITDKAFTWQEPGTMRTKIDATRWLRILDKVENEIKENKNTLSE
jgi:hypothetical protein